METTGLAATNNFQPVTDSSGSDCSSSSSGSSNMKDSSDTAGTDNGNRQDEQPGVPDGQMGDVAGSKDGAGMVVAISPLIGFSSDEAVANASNGSFTMVKKVFGYDASSDGDAIISKSLADFNDLKVGDTISVADVNDSDTTYKLTIVGIYKNSTDSNQQLGGPMRSTASDPANAIYTSVSTLKSMELDADSDSNSAAQLNYTYVCSSKSDYETFAKDVKKAGLGNDYTVSSADVENYESSLVPLDNLSKFALTLLVVVLAVGRSCWWSSPCSTCASANMKSACSPPSA